MKNIKDKETNLLGILKEIEFLREEIQKLQNNGHSFTSNQIYEVSVELDKVIDKYYIASGQKNGE